MTIEERRSLYREEQKNKAVQRGVYNGDGQLFCRSGSEAFCFRYPAEYRDDWGDEVLEFFARMQKVFNLRQCIIDDYRNGVIDISYVNGPSVLKLSEDAEFMMKADELRGYGLYPFHGVKWDGQASPVFFCKMDLPEKLDEKILGCEIIPSGCASGGISFCSLFRCYQMGAYFWIDGKLYNDYIEFEGHDGVLYPVVAFPGLAREDGIRADKVVII